MLHLKDVKLGKKLQNYLSCQKKDSFIHLKLSHFIIMEKLSSLTLSLHMISWHI